jgi:GNAT superfamily N-acetyltransferase
MANSAAAPLSFRRYGGRADLPALLTFASEATRLRAPLGAIWHPGDIVWGLKPAFDAGADLHAASVEGQVIAALWFEEPGDLRLEVLPDHEHRVAELIGWAEGRTPAASLDLTVFDGDRRRQDTLTSLGFERRGPEGVQFDLALASVREGSSPPQGLRLRDGVGIDPDARSASHRDAWNALDHIGLPNARSGFTTDVYRSLLDAPGYDPRLDIVLQSPDGRLVANCIAWADPASGVGVFEPVGTHPDFRGRGLAGVVIAEGLRRLRALGLSTARIGTAHFNAPAIAAYAAMGFQQVDRSSVWSKPLNLPRPAASGEVRKPDGL